MCQANGLKEKKQNSETTCYTVEMKQVSLCGDLIGNPKEIVHFHVLWADLVISNIALISQVSSCWVNLTENISRSDTGIIGDRRLHIRSTFPF